MPHAILMKNTNMQSRFLGDFFKSNHKLEAFPETFLVLICRITLTEKAEGPFMTHWEIDLLLKSLY